MSWRLFSLCTLLLLLPPLECASSAARLHAARRQLLAAVSRGDTAAVDAALARAAGAGAPARGALLDELVDGTTPLLEALRVRFLRVEGLAGSVARDGAALGVALRRQRGVLRALLRAGARAGASCPVIDALVYRDPDATDILLGAMRAEELADCMTSTLFGPDSGLLHLSARTHAAGFARLLFHACAETRRADALRGDGGGDDGGARVLFKHLRLRQDGAAWADDGPAFAALLQQLCGSDADELAVHKADVDALSGAIEVDALAAAAARLGVPLTSGGALERRTAAGLTPLLLACASGRSATAQRLARLGADRAAVASTDNRSCAHLAAVRGYDAPVTGDADARDVFGRTAAAVALRSTLAGARVAEVGADGAAQPAAVARRFDAAAHAAAGWALAPASLLAAMQLSSWAAGAVPLAASQHAAIHTLSVRELREGSLALLRDVLSLEQPYALRGGGGASDTDAWQVGSRRQRRVTRAAFLAAFGDLVVEHGILPYAARYGALGGRSALRAFLAAHMPAAAAPDAAETRAGSAPPQYIFDSSAMGAAPALFAPLVARLNASGALAGLSSSGKYLQQLMLGPPGSGSMLHFHGAAANLLLVGAKLWLFSPPRCAAFSSVPALPFFRAVYAGAAAPAAAASPAVARLLACHAALGAPLLRHVQTPGDIVVVPEHWGHAVLNLADAVAIALEGG